MVRYTVVSLCARLGRQVTVELEVVVKLDSEIDGLLLISAYPRRTGEKDNAHCAPEDNTRRISTIIFVHLGVLQKAGTY